jgi:hypothetical protein
LLNEEILIAVLSSTYSDMEQAVNNSNIVYFLYGFLKLNTTGAQRLRIYLKFPWRQGYRMFQPMRSDKAFEYAAFFAKMTVVLYRNGFPTPSDQFLSCINSEDLFTIEDKKDF